jgi:hypothetical protein
MVDFQSETLAAERKQQFDSALSFAEACLKNTENLSTPTALLGSQILLAFSAVSLNMPLQQVMDLLLQNMPAIYAIVTEVHAQRPPPPPPPPTTLVFF